MVGSPEIRKETGRGARLGERVGENKSEVGRKEKGEGDRDTLKGFVVNFSAVVKNPLCSTRVP